MNELTIRRIVDKLPPTWSRLPVFIKKYITDGSNIRLLQKKVREYQKSKTRKSCDTDDFFKVLEQYCLYMNEAGADKYIQSYFEEDDLTVLSKNNPRSTHDDVTLLCCVKNDLQRIKSLVEHHRKIGINRMIFVDNDSDDGTREWLMGQAVDVLFTKETYHSGAKAAWIRKVQSMYGFDKWYLIVDSDELFSYIGMERCPIQEMIAYAHKHDIKRVRSLMVDMYPCHDLYKEDGSEIYDYLLDYRWFDRDTYIRARNFRGMMIMGGPRQRVFGKDNGFMERLTKYPLVYAKEDDVWNDHLPLPFEKNFNSPCVGVLKHYKFLEGDFDRYKQYINDGNFFQGSSSYKIYLTERTPFFFFDGSVEYRDSSSFEEIPMIERIDDGL